MKAIISEAENVRPRGGPASNPRKMASEAASDRDTLLALIAMLMVVVVQG